MISGIYPYLLSMSVGSLKKFENSSQTAVSSAISSLKGNAPTDKENNGNALGSEEGRITLTTSGSISQGSTGLFAEISDASLGQEIPQMIEAQKGFNTYVRASRGEGGITEHSLDTFA